MKVLLTGGSGFIGSRVAAHFARAGIEVVGLGRSPWALPAGQGRQIPADLLAAENLGDLVAEAGCSHLVHLAWIAEHGRYWTAPENVTWAAASVRLVEAFLKAGGSHVTVAGTCAEYDWAHGYLSETVTPLAPALPYGVAKDATRRLVAAACKLAGKPCAWGRIFFPYGPGEAPARLLPSLIAVFWKGTPPFGVNAGAWRDFVHVDDVAGGLAALATAAADGAFNVATGEPLQIRRLVEEVANRFDADPAAVLDLASARPGDPPFLVGDSARLRALGWAPAIGLGEGLDDLVARLRAEWEAAPAAAEQFR